MRSEEMSVAGGKKRFCTGERVRIGSYLVHKNRRKIAKIASKTPRECVERGFLLKSACFCEESADFAKVRKTPSTQLVYQSLETNLMSVRYHQ
jgi:hypothetical protein